MSGVIMEDDADSIVARVYPKQDQEIPLSEQTVAQVLLLYCVIFHNYINCICNML